MLTKCPECNLPVSDKAIACPHCGYPLKKISTQRPSSKRKRLPNGFGQITKINDYNLRKPYRAIVTVGTYPNGKPIQKLLKPEAYFATYNDAYAALVEYNRNPYDLDPSITVKELYEKWTAEYFKSLTSQSSIRTITSSWAYCGSIYDMRVKEVRTRHLKGVIDSGYRVEKGKNIYPTASIKARIKSMLNLLFDYAVEYEMTDKNYARSFSLNDDIVAEKEKDHKEHLAFTDEEMNILWQHAGESPWIDLILIQCYSGWRPQELGLIEIANINWTDQVITGGMKTEAGTNRPVPIHSRIKPLVEMFYERSMANGWQYLYTVDGSKLTYEKYQYRFNIVRDSLKLDGKHRPHDGRKHFVTAAKKAGVDEYAIKYLVGHNITDVTEKVYTQRELPWLRSEIEKIK